jgi:osmoprotectant transport system permease protein
VAVLALLVDLTFAAVQRYAVSPGLTGRGLGRGARDRTPSREMEVAVQRAAGETELQHNR